MVDEKTLGGIKMADGNMLWAISVRLCYNLFAVCHNKKQRRQYKGHNTPQGLSQYHDQGVCFGRVMTLKYFLVLLPHCIHFSAPKCIIAVK